MKQIYSRFFINLFYSNMRFPVIAVMLLLGLNTSAQVLSFKNFTLESGSANSQGAVYRFTDVSANVDALVTVTELHRVVLIHIDSMFTGAEDGFQPMVSSTGGKGDHYALFNVVFVTAGTVVPVNLVEFSGQVYDINGSNQMNEYASITMENPSWEYSNGTPAITVTQSGDDITGVSANKNLGQTIDTANQNNSFVVATTTLNSFTVKFGFEQNVTGWSGNDQFSLLFSGHSLLGTLAGRLHDFSAQLNADKVKLQWSTGVEENFSHFVVQRSVNGKDFTDVAVIFSNTLKHSYEYSDDLRSASFVYYRLKMVDVGRKSQISGIRLIKAVSASSSVTIQAYPNPVVNELRITIPASWQSAPVSYTLFDAIGSVKKRILNSANQTESIGMRDLEAGLYIVKVTSGGQSGTKQIMKMR